MIRHIGLIPDGNRRWARANSISYEEAYLRTMRRIVDCTKIFFSRNLRSASIYLLSSANLSRDNDELNCVFEAETYLLSTLLPPVMEEMKCRVIHAGRCSLLPPSMQQALLDLAERTKFFSERTLYLLIAYDPFDELHAAIDLATRRNEEFVPFAHFWVPEPIDVVIRSAGGPALLSNFLPLQCGYAQIHTLISYFPDCTDDDILTILDNVNTAEMLHGL